MSLIRKRAVWLYMLLVLICAYGYARFDGYKLDGDAVAFMDLADAIHTHNLPLIMNGYWNPGYPAVLAAAEALGPPSRWSELQTFYWANFFIFACAAGSMIFFVESLVLARRTQDPQGAKPSLGAKPLKLIGLASLLFSAGLELPLSAVRADSLLLVFFLLAGGCLLRLNSSRSFAWFPLLGLSLGCAYLTKSFAFVPSVLTFGTLFCFGLTRSRPARTRAAGGAVLAGLIFLALAAPYVTSISRQRARLTTGDSARLNYAFFIDGMGRWHEAHSGRMGHATGPLKHPEQLLLEQPAVYSYAQHQVGTYPLWFDPAYWADGATPHFWLKGQLQRVPRMVELLLRFFLGRLDLLLIVAVLLVCGNSLPRLAAAYKPYRAVMLLGLSFFLIYSVVDFQDRYLTAGFLLIMLPVLASLVERRSGASGSGTAVALISAALVAGTAVSTVLELRRQLSVHGASRGAFDRQTWDAARGLEELGIKPGSAVACFGSRACMVDHYWARLSRTPIVAEIATDPEAADPGVYWQSLTDQDAVLDVLRRQGAAAVVARFAATAQEPAGWHQLGTSDFYAYVLRPAGR